MDTILVAARLVHFAAQISLAGIFAFLVLVAAPSYREAGAALSPALRRRLAILAWASLVLLLASGAAWLVREGENMSGAPLAAVLAQGLIGTVLTQTQFGHVWLIRAALLVPLTLALAGSGRWRGLDWLAALASMAMLAALAWAGHAAATEGLEDVVHLAADVVHLLATGAWLGALLPLAWFLAEARSRGDQQAAAAARGAVLRFSDLGLTCVAALLVTGTVNAWLLTGTVPALLGTDYGHLLLIKLGLVAGLVALAAINRQSLAPRLAPVLYGKKRLETWQAIAQLQRNVLIEVALGLFVIAVVAALGTLPPGLHSEPRWPFSYRLSLDLVRAAPDLRNDAIVTAALALIGLGLTILGLIGGKRRWLSLAVGLVLFLGLGWRPIELLAVAAYPTSYLRSPVPYTATSIVAGGRLYAEHCVACHGAEGRGDGPRAGELPIAPADLTAAHLFDHSDGDLFWWISHGMDDGVMPGLADRLDPEQRWQLIHFIHARAAGIEASDMSAEVTQFPAPIAADFAFTAPDGSQATLKSLLARAPVLLVFFTSPAALPRLQQLARWQENLGHLGVEILAIGAEYAEMNLPDFVVAGSPEIEASYRLFERRARGATLPPPADHIEFLIDRALYLRARWQPGDLPDWRDYASLRDEIDKLETPGLAAALPEVHQH